MSLSAGLIALLANCWAADVHHQKTAAAPLARYEIIQSTLGPKLTFKLDRFTGQVWQLAQSSKDLMGIWEPMIVMGAPKTPGSTPRFQIFLSGISPRFSYLIDTAAGTVWILAAVDESEDAWVPMTSKN